MKVFKTLCVLISAGLLLASCANVAHIEKDDSVNFNNYKTFAWVSTADNKTDSIKHHVSDLTEQKVRSAVDAELAKYGWHEAKHRPDVLLSYDILVERAVRQSNDAVYSQPFSRLYYNPYLRRWGTIYYPSQFMGYEPNQYQVKEGTLTITMMDAKTEKTVWQGWTTEEVNSRNLTTKEIQSSVRSIFRKFDVAKK